jgi:DNA repair protein RadC
MSGIGGGSLRDNGGRRAQPAVSAVSCLQPFEFIGGHCGIPLARGSRMPNETKSVDPSLPSGPRERLALRGEAALSDAELIAVVLGTGSGNDSVHVIAARLLAEAGGVGGLSAWGVDRLSATRGIGSSKACRLRAAMELGRRIATKPLSRGVPITSSRDVDAAVRMRLRDSTREHFVAIVLDARNRPLAEIDVAVGGLTACALNPADVFREVLRWPAAAVIFVHNHPSGDTFPSAEDIAITDRLRSAGRLIGVEVLDHLIIGEDGYFSFLDRGLFTGKSQSPRP